VRTNSTRLHLIALSGALALSGFACGADDEETLNDAATGGDNQLLDGGLFDSAIVDAPVSPTPDAATPDAMVDAAPSIMPGATGPKPYLKPSDSPFFGVDFAYFHLEDFEDHALNTPGLVSEGRLSSTFGPGLIDSVDMDDGNLDNRCVKPQGTCDAWWGAGTLTFSFNAQVLGALPTHVGAVWTDGSGKVSFEAFGADGASLYKGGPHLRTGISRRHLQQLDRGRPLLRRPCAGRHLQDHHVEHRGRDRGRPRAIRPRALIALSPRIGPRHQRAQRAQPRPGDRGRQGPRAFRRALRPGAGIGRTRQSRAARQPAAHLAVRAHRDHVLACDPAEPR
jgi:hypothetical protein